MNHNGMYYRRPILLTIFAALEIILGAFIMLGGALIAVSGIPDGLLEETGINFEVSAMVLGAGLIVFGLIFTGIGVALFSGKMWGWWFAVIMTALSLLSAVLMMQIFAAVIQLIILLYLMSGNTRGWFRHRTEERRRQRR